MSVFCERGTPVTLDTTGAQGQEDTAKQLALATQQVAALEAELEVSTLHPEPSTLHPATCTLNLAP